MSPPPDTDLPASARTALACLDLTSLNDGDTPADIDALCAKAIGPAGKVDVATIHDRSDVEIARRMFIRGAFENQSISLLDAPYE